MNTARSAPDASRSARDAENDQSPYPDACEPNRGTVKQRETKGCALTEQEEALVSLLVLGEDWIEWHPTRLRMVQHFDTGDVRREGPPPPPEPIPPSKYASAAEWEAYRCREERWAYLRENDVVRYSVGKALAALVMLYHEAEVAGMPGIFLARCVWHTYVSDWEDFHRSSRAYNARIGVHWMSDLLAFHSVHLHGFEGYRPRRIIARHYRIMQMLDQGEPHRKICRDLRCSARDIQDAKLAYGVRSE